MNDLSSAAPAIDLSVVIVTYNNEPEIGPCLQSLAMQQGAFVLQVIVIDNASSDQTQKCIHETTPQFPYIHLIFNPQNRGFTAAVNQGLEQAQGQYILLLNPDIELPPDSFQNLIPLFDSHANVGIVAPQFLNSDGESIQPSCRRFPRLRDVWYHALGLPWLFPSSDEFNGWKMGGFDHTIERYVDQPQGAFLLAKMDAYISVGQLDERFAMFFSDVDWCRRFVNKGWKILFTPKSKVIHHKGRSIVQRCLPLIWSSHFSFYRYFRKYNTNRAGVWSTGILLFGMAVMRSVVQMSVRIFTK